MFFSLFRLGFCTFSLGNLGTPYDELGFSLIPTRPMNLSNKDDKDLPNQVGCEKLSDI